MLKLIKYLLIFPLNSTLTETLRIEFKFYSERKGQNFSNRSKLQILASTTVNKLKTVTENILPNTGSRHDVINSFFHNL